MARRRGPNPRSSRRVLGLCGLVAAGLLVWLLVPRFGTSPLPRLQEREPPRVAADVTLDRLPIGGLDADTLRAWLQRERPRWETSPVAAVLDPATGGVIPHLNGRRLLLDATIEQALAAEPGTRLLPRLAAVRPERTLDDFPLAPLYQANPAKRQVAFLINVAWGNEPLLEMLDILDAYRVQASFFLVGRWAERFPELARRIAEGGHEINSHGYDDTLAPGRLSQAEARRDLRQAQQAIMAATGRPPRYYSPHRGELSPDLLKAAHALGYRVIMWTVDTVDWRDPPPETIVRRVLDNVDHGAFILMHPREVTVAALPGLIEQLRAQGYEPVRLSRLLDPNLR